MGEDMQLTVRDVSRFLNTPESTVIRWIKQRGLPSQHVGGQYRFNRVDLLEWATANRIKVSVEVFDHLEAEDEPGPSLVGALEAGGIFYQVKDTSKELALKAMVEVLPLPEGVDRELLLRLFLAREASASTAIGDGVALPHVRNPIVLHVERPMVTLCFLERPVDFGALDGKPVSVLFSLICPTMRSHLQTLSRLSYSLHDDGFKEVVMCQAPRDEILREARRVEVALDEPPAGGAR
jgi:PTS system nitrogen regulatory IIA component